MEITLDSLLEFWYFSMKCCLAVLLATWRSVMGRDLLPLVNLCISSTISTLFHRPTASRDLPTSLLRPQPKKFPVPSAGHSSARVHYVPIFCSKNYPSPVWPGRSLWSLRSAMHISGIHSILQIIISRPSCSKAKLTKPLSPCKMLHYPHLLACTSSKKLVSLWRCLHMLL